MNLHEYQAKSLLAGMGMPCPKEIAIQQISQRDSYPTDFATGRCLATYCLPE